MTPGPREPGSPPGPEVPRARRGAVFLDRDGTLLDELGYLADPERVRLLPGAAAGVAALNRAGWPVVLVTNQSGIARGLLDEARLELVHRRLRERLAEGGAHLELLLHCPHHPEFPAADAQGGRCECRKPAPGLLLEAARRLDLDLERSWIVGDAERDLEAGRRAGVGGLLLVRTGKGRETEARLAPVLRARARVFDDLEQAAEHILGQRSPAAAGPQGR